MECQKEDKEETNKIVEEIKKEEKENQKEDIYLKDYLKFKKEFLRVALVLGVKISKKETSKFIQILKPYKPPYKNINPIKKSKDSNENIYLTKFTYDEKSILEKDILNPEKNNNLKKEDKFQ